MIKKSLLDVYNKNLEMKIKTWNLQIVFYYVIESLNIKKILSLILKIIKELDLIESLYGHGKGKYKFKK